MHQPNIFLVFCYLTPKENSTELTSEITKFLFRSERYEE
jgi:hypothetical protein